MASDRPGDSVKPTGAYLTGTLLYITSGVLIWALHFNIVYGVHTLACAGGYAADTTAFIIFAVTLIALVAVGAASYLHRVRRDISSDEVREERIFERRVMDWLALLAALGILWAGIAPVFVSPCAA